jgi:hypothetical protein
MIKDRLGWTSVARRAFVVEDNNMYRNQAEVPMYPKEETVTEKNERAEAIAKKAKKKRDTIGILGVTAFPCAALSVLGAEWYHMSSALAVTSIFAIIIASIGVGSVTANRLDW